MSETRIRSSRGGTRDRIGTKCPRMRNLIGNCTLIWLVDVYEPIFPVQNLPVCIWRMISIAGRLLSDPCISLGCGSIARMLGRLLSHVWAV